MKLSMILLYIAAFIGLIFMGNLTHESYHYFVLRQTPNITIKDLCVVAVPIPENNYSHVGFVEYTYKGEDNSSNSEIGAIIIGYVTCLGGIFLWEYLRQHNK